MIDVGGHALVLDVAAADVEPWLQPVVEAGRDAAFVDTGYIHALLNDRDQRHGEVRNFHEGLSARLYTSALVVAEAARQEIYPDVVDGLENEGGVPSRLMKTDAGVGRQEGTPCRMFAGSPLRGRMRSRSRWTSSPGRALAG